MAECSMERHEWDERTVDKSEYKKFAMICNICGAGHTLELTLMPTGEVKADITVLAAKGESKVSRRLIMLTLVACEDALREYERMGFVIIRGKTIIPMPK